jgi:glycosyltransferase involved in cell wall biosynthesis
MKKKVLILSNWFLYPVRNGMELPIAMYVKELSNKVDFDFHLVNTEENVQREMNSRNILNSKYFQSVRTTICPPIPIIKRIINEIFLRKPFYDDLDTKSLNLLNIKKYDCIWVTNAKLASIVYRLGEIGGLNTLLTTNDAIYYFYYERAIASFLGREKKSIGNIFNLLRLPFILLNERAYLKRYSAVHVQTELEKERLQWIMPRESETKLIVAPNGIKLELLSITHKPSHSNIILLMNHMTEGREQQALWFLNKIWPKVVSARPELKLLVVGAMPNNAAQLYYDKFPNVEFTGFVSNLQDIYSTVCLSVIPHYQSSGYINRLYDALTAGVPVIISSQIARTVKGFTSGVHGVVVQNRKKLVENIIALSEANAEKQRNLLVKNGRQFVKNSFRWKDSTIMIEEAIQKIK